MTHMKIRRLPRKCFYDIYVAAQQNFTWQLNRGIWKMIRHSKGHNCREKLVKNGFLHTHTHCPPKSAFVPNKNFLVWCWFRIYLLETNKSYSLLNNTYHFQTRLGYIHKFITCLYNYEHILNQAPVPQLLILNKQLLGRNTCTE